MPPELAAIRGEDCCVVGCNQGCGTNCFWEGNICCAPEWLQLYSIRQSIGAYRGPLGDLLVMDKSLDPGNRQPQVAIINQQQPVYNGPSQQQAPYPGQQQQNPQQQQYPQLGYNPVNDQSARQYQ